MPTLRPFQVIVLAIFGLLALAGLVVFATFNGFGKSAEEVGTVVIWGTLPQKQVEPGIRQLKDLYEEYAKVTYVERPAATFDADVAAALASGTGPDLMLISQEHLMVERDRLTLIPYASLSERNYRDTYLPIFEVYLTEGGSYGIPLLVDPLVLYYNKQELASAGVVAPPSTWEVVSGLAPLITRFTDAQNISRSTIALGEYDNIEHATAILSLLFFQAGHPIALAGPSGVRANLGAGSDSSFGVSATESALTFYTEFANPTKTTYTWNRSLPYSRMMFATGDLVFYLGFASERPVIEATNPNLAFDMAAVPQPGTASTRVTYGRAYALAIPKAAKNPAGAYDVAFALGKGDVLPVLARSVGMAPGVRSQLQPSNEDLYEPVYYPQALIAKGWLSPAPPATEGIFAAMIGNVTSGRMRAREALGTADQALNAALAR